MNSLLVAVDSWIIQDGNYGDFSVGDTEKFALEFAGETLRPSATREPFFRNLGHGFYEVCAQVLFVGEAVWVIDFGFRAFWESKPPEFVMLGTWVEGKISVGIDPFFYMEYLYKIRDMPNLFYKWHITSIMRDDTPWLFEAKVGGGGVYSRDETKEVWSSVSRTDAWNDDEGRASYVLIVEQSDV